jgi:type I restriction enzyme S subunit
MQQLLPAEGKSVPELRFEEFRESGVWEEKKLAELSLKIGDGIHATPIYDDYGDYFFINGNNLIDGKIICDEKTKKVSEDEFEKYKTPLGSNTILLSINGTIGNISFYNNEKVILGKSACFINVDETKLNKKFAASYLATNTIEKYFTTELTGSTIKNLSLKSIRDAVLRIPGKKEQQKIADCLSSLDELITAQAEKIEALKEHKKGLMQGLFPNPEGA